MSISPVKASHLPGIQRAVARFNNYATPRSYLLSTKTGNKYLVGGGLTLWVTNLLTPLNAMLSVSILESFGIVKEILGRRKLPALKRKNLSKGSLIARTAGTLLLGGGAALMLAITKAGVLNTPFFRLLGLAASVLGILTLAVDKTVRMVKERTSVTQVRNLIRTSADTETLSQVIQDEKMSPRNQLRLIKRLRKRGVVI